MARGTLVSGRTTDRRQKGDLRIANKMKEFRAVFGFPRSTVATVTGIHLTSITRIELGQRMFSAHSLSHIITGLRETVKIMSPGKLRTFDKWAMELLEVVAVVEEEERLRRKASGERSFTTPEGRR